jgi:hypothetical protein
VEGGTLVMSRSSPGRGGWRTVSLCEVNNAKTVSKTYLIKG